MSKTLKITVLGGEATGLEKSFDFSKAILVGRSRSADLHLPEPDVSGRHFEFVPSEDGCLVRVMSRNGLVVNGSMVHSGETASVTDNSIVEAGTKARIRVNLVSVVPELTTTNVSMSSEPVSVVDVVSMIDKSPLPDKAAAAPEVPEVKDVGTRSDFTEPEGAATLPEDGDAETAPDPPAPAPGGDGQFDGPPEVEQDGMTSNVTLTGAEATGFIDGETNAGQEGDDEEGLTIAEGDGETQEMKTRVGSILEIDEGRRQLARKKTFKRLRIGAAILVLIVALIGVWLFLAWSSHAIDVNGPYLANGDFDEVQTT